MDVEAKVGATAFQIRNLRKCDLGLFQYKNIEFGEAKEDA